MPLRRIVWHDVELCGMTMDVADCDDGVEQIGMVLNDVQWHWIVLDYALMPDVRNGAGCTGQCTIPLERVGYVEIPDGVAWHWIVRHGVE